MRFREVLEPVVNAMNVDDLEKLEAMVRIQVRLLKACISAEGALEVAVGDRVRAALLMRKSGVNKSFGEIIAEVNALVQK